MGTKDPRVDAYIAKSADFAKPILTHLRKLIHDNCPSVEETMKWSFPHFTYKAKADRSPRILRCMASFKRDCAIGHWDEPSGDSPSLAAGTGPTPAQHGGIVSLADLPKHKEFAREV